ETITKVSRLFNGSAHDILNELLQNARRAGASCVRVTLMGQPGCRLLTITDDGHGIADPATIVTLGRSGWADDTREREDPAGMGVFSLAGRDVIVRSWSRPEHQGWCAHIPAGAWETSRPIAIEADPIARGTAISLAMPEAWVPTLRTTLEAVALFYPLPVLIDGEELPRRPWLAGAVHVEDWRGCRIGVFDSHASDWPLPSNVRINFHGVTVATDMPMVDEVDRGRKWTVRIDIIDAPEIQLVLPARKEPVENHALLELRAAAKVAIFRALAKVGGHRLSHKVWLEADALGIALPEADAYLTRWTAPCADYRQNWQGQERTRGAAMVLVPDQAPIIAQPMQRALAGRSPFGGPLVEAQRHFEGYGWYDALARVTDVRLRIDAGETTFEVTDVDEAPESAASGLVEAISLVITVVQDGDTSQLIHAADVAFSPDTSYCDDVDEVGIFVRRGSTATAYDVAELLQQAVFDPSSDSGDDSYETQVDRFRASAQKRTVRLLEGGDAAIEAQLRMLLQAHPWIVPADRTVSVTLTREKLDVVVTPRMPEAA
ncbi:ATP-binding protein, partial [Sphingomonas bacterium]|uniref:ATP-binding protein n=1 Tax=Sphingomonas bacterium TaxID=1895847 RepID=UPI0015774361